MQLAGKVALVTGGASGIGAGICERFHHEGATVIVVDRDGEGAAKTAAGLPGSSALELDIASPDAVGCAFDQVLGEFGRIDIVVNAAGVDDIDTKAKVGEHYAAGSPLEITSTLSNAQWDRMIAINLSGTFYVLRASLRAMLPRQSGSIVLISSLAGVSGAAGLPHYSASKAGVLGLMQSVAKEVGDRNVRVNAITPGAVDTPMFRRAPGGQENYASAQLGSIPLRRFGTPADLAAAALFLASDDGAYVTGETLNVNGGTLAI
jgi:NAD(P)-dependent dehydrogenase (short-subunit alcohol dehydrogenase family)